MNLKNLGRGQGRDLFTCPFLSEAAHTSLYAEFEIHLSKISEAVGLMDGNVSNLLKTVESGILEPLKQAGYIESYEKVPNGSGVKYVIKRTKIDKQNTGREAGSVKEGGRVGKGTRQGR